MAENSDSPYETQAVPGTEKAQGAQGAQGTQGLLGNPATLLELMLVALRLVTVVFALAALIGAAVVLGVIGEEDFTGDLVDSTEGAAGWIICLAVLTMIAGAVFIGLRSLKAFGVLQLDENIFLIVIVADIIVSALFENAYLASGIAAALFAGGPNYWKDIADVTEDDEVQSVHDGLAASSAFCFFNMILFAVLVILQVLLLLKQRKA